MKPQKNLNYFEHGVDGCTVDFLSFLSLPYIRDSTQVLQAVY